MLFVAKSPILVDYNKITKASISRVAGVLRSFDITVKLSTELEHTFTSVNKDEYNHVKGFLERKNVRVKEIGEDTSLRTLETMDLGSDEDDDDDESEDDRGPSKTAGKDRRAGGNADDDESGEPAIFSLVRMPSSLTDHNSQSMQTRATEEDEDFASDSAPSSPSDTDSEAASDDDAAMSDVTDDMVNEAKKKSTKGSSSTKKKTDEKKKPAAAAASSAKSSKPAAKSKDMIEDSDEDVMDVDGSSEADEPKSKKQKTA